MIHRVIAVGRWVADFLFAIKDYDDEGVLGCLYDIDAPLSVMRRANRIMDSGRMNRGFTYANPYLKRAVIVVGPATSHKQFLNTLVHEIHHLSVAIASSLGIDLDEEGPAYISGDAALALADTICSLGCPHCE